MSKYIQNNIRVGVVRGSPDHGYEHSIASGKYMLEKLPTKYRPVDIFIDTEGMWHVSGVPISPSSALRQVDVVFNALHGAYTHEGGLVRVCEREGVPYTGSGHLASSIAFHKDLTKKQLREAGVRTPLSLVVRREEDRDASVAKIFNLLSGMLVAKPLRSSLSADVRIIGGHRDLNPVLDELFIFHDALLIEEYILGNEVSIGLIENFRGQKEYLFVPLEIKNSQFKIFNEVDSRHALPAHGLSAEIKNNIHILAQKLHHLFGARHYSQAEVIVHRSGALYVIDFNTHPYLGREGLYMKMLKTVGARPEDFIETLVSSA